MSKSIFLALGAGLLAVLFYASVATGREETLFLSFFTQLPLFLAGLGLGYPAVVVAAIAGVAFCLLLVSVSYGVALVLALAFAFLHAGPVILFVRQALLSRTDAEGNREWYPLGHLVAWVAGTGAAFFLVLFFVLAGGEQGIEAVVRGFLSEMLTSILQTPTPQAERLVEAIAPFFPAFAIGWWLFMVIANGALAQGLLVRFGRNVRPSPDFAKMKLPDWLTYTTAGAALVLIAAEPGSVKFFSRNLVLILCVPFFLLGLAVVHTTARTYVAYPRWVLIPFYFLFILFGGFAAAIVTGFGFVEQAIGIRRRLPVSVNAGEK